MPWGESLQWKLHILWVLLIWHSGNVWAAVSLWPHHHSAATAAMQPRWVGWQPHQLKCGGKGEKNSGRRSKGNTGLLNGVEYHLDGSCTGRHVKLLGYSVKSQMPKRFCEVIEVSNLYALLIKKATSAKYLSDGKIVSLFLYDRASTNTTVINESRRDSRNMAMLHTVLLSDSIRIHRIECSQDVHVHKQE